MVAHELHVQLYVDYADDEKVAALRRFGSRCRPARDLFVQMMCYSKRMRSDGRVPFEQIGICCAPDAASVGRKDAALLEEVGLVVRTDSGWLLPSYLKRNKSRAQLEAERAEKAEAAARGNHERWHIGRGKPDPHCELCRIRPSHTPDRIEDRTPDRTPDIGGSSVESPETETETETETVSKNTSPPPVAVGSDDDPDFAAFWSAYPRKVGKPSGRKAWRAAVVKRKADPAVIIKAAEAVRDDPARRGRPIEYTPHPATWLNDERYNDQPADRQTAISGWWDN